MTDISGKNRIKEFKEAGNEEALSIKNILLLMLNGYSKIKLSSRYPKTSNLITKACFINDQIDTDEWLDDHVYGDLTGEGKEIFRLLKLFDVLSDLGFVDRYIWFSNEDSPEDGCIDMSGKLDNTPAYCTSWIARAILCKDEKLRSYIEDRDSNYDGLPRSVTFELIVYQLNAKGYDIALKYQEHEDNAARFKQQSGITTLASKASQSSAITARYALIAGVAIAIGSLGNLSVNLWERYMDSKSSISFQIEKPVSRDK
jgi:hypothetical protein